MKQNELLHFSPVEEAVFEAMKQSEAKSPSIRGGFCFTLLLHRDGSESRRCCGVKRVGMKKCSGDSQFDNIATPGHPVWRRRLYKPYTCWAVRMGLVRQAAELPDEERRQYVRNRLTQLDKALSDDEAEALERWLDCEEMLGGRVKISDYGDRTGGGSGEVSPIPDRVIMAMEEHARLKRFMPRQARTVLRMLAMMMEAPGWDYTAAGIALAPHLRGKKAERYFIEACRNAAAYLVNNARKKR